MNCWEEGSKKHLSEEVEYYDAMCFEWTLGGHKKLLYRLDILDSR